MSAKIEVTDSGDKTEHKKAVSEQLATITMNRLKVVAPVLAVLLLMVFIFGYVHTRNQLEALKHPANSAAAQSQQQIIDRVSGLINLPANESPTFAKVTDVSKLQTNSFFQQAQNGDVVLIYPKSGWTLLYRPATGKVIAYAQLKPSS